MEEKLQILKDLVLELSHDNSSSLKNRIKSAISDVEYQYKRDLNLISTALDDLEKAFKK